MGQFGFLFDQSRCTGCNACVIACKQWHDIPVGSAKWLRVYQWETGSFPDLRLRHLAIPCYHCENPVCVTACPNRAIRKELYYGAVLVDEAMCRGTRRCFKACPYGSPQYTDDESGTKMSKCNMCIDRLAVGLSPICVLSCPMRALEFGPIEQLRETYGNLRRLEDMPRDSITTPAVAFIAASQKKKVVLWDSGRALALWQHRQTPTGETLPDVFREAADVTTSPAEIVGRHRLVLKAETSAEKLHHTTDDE